MVKNVSGSSGIVLLKIEVASNKPAPIVEIAKHRAKLIFMVISPAVKISFRFSFFSAVLDSGTTPTGIFFASFLAGTSSPLGRFYS